jgi:tetratricopeptide (TPR) repeat protein
MESRLTIAATAVLSMLAGAPASAANTYSALLDAHKYAEAEQAAQARLLQDPADRDALVAKSEAILGGGSASRIEEAVKLAEQCVAAHPRESNCHLALGNALGAKAVHAGATAGLGYAHTIRDAFKTAVQLDPHNLDARFSLLQYYLEAPAIVGGGLRKAQALASETAAVNSDASRLMLGQIELARGHFASAEAQALAADASGDDALADNQRDLLLKIRARYFSQKQYADSERISRELQKLFPDCRARPGCRYQ